MTDLLQINIRTNVDRNNADSLKEFWEVIDNNEWNSNPNAYIAPVRNYGNYDKEVCIDGEEFALINKDRLNSLYLLGSELSSRLLIPAPKNTYCSAVIYGSFVVDADGDIYSCWNMIGKKDKTIGNVSKGVMMDSEYMRWLLYEPSESCKKCQLYPICLGGCPYSRFELGDKNCDLVRFTYIDNLNLLYKIYCDKKTEKNEAPTGVSNA